MPSKPEDFKLRNANLYVQFDADGKVTQLKVSANVSPIQYMRAVEGVTVKTNSTTAAKLLVTDAGQQIKQAALKAAAKAVSGAASKPEPVEEQDDF